jgi:hypothetical protein
MSSSIPIIANSDRRSTATLSASTGPVTVGFPVFGGADDLSVFVDGELIDSADWTLTSASALNPATDILPSGDGRVTFDAAQTGDVEIIGEIKPARTAQLAPGVGVPAETQNLALSKIWAAIRESYSWGKASIKFPVGERATALPGVDERKGKILFFNAHTGNPEVVAPSTGGVSAASGVVNDTLLSGSTIKDVLDQFAKNPINVMGYPYYAKGDGVTDDRVAIQTAMDDGASQRRPVFFPKTDAFYRVTKNPSGAYALKLNSHMTLFSIARAEIKLADSQNSTHLFSNAGGTTPTDIEAFGLKMNGNRDNQTGSGHIFAISGCKRVKIHDNEICYARTYGIAAQTSGQEDIDIYRNYIHDTGSDGIDIKDFSADNIRISVVENEFANTGLGPDEGGTTFACDARCKGLLVRGNRIRDISANLGNNAGISVRAESVGAIISENEITSVSGSTAISVSGDDAIISNNTITGMGAGISTINPRTIVMGNKIRGCTLDGIGMNVGSDHSVVALNSINSVGRDCLRILGNDVLFAHNNLSNATNYGWRVVAGANRTRVGVNWGTGNGSDFFTDAGTGTIREWDSLSANGESIAAAATLNLDSATGDCVDVTGNTGITAITLSEGRQRSVRFTGTPELAHGASLVLPGGANIVAAAGDFAIFRGSSGGVVRCIGYFRASGKAVTPPAFSEITGKPTTVAGYSITDAYGKQAIWIDAAELIPTITNGAAINLTETATNDCMLETLDYDASTQEFATFRRKLPKSWDRGTITFRSYWSADSGTPGDTVEFALQAVAVSNDDPLDAAWGTEQVSADALIATGDNHVGSESSAITVGGSPADGDLILFRVKRNVANDNLAADARLLGIELFITTNALVDA